MISPRPLQVLLVDHSAAAVADHLVRGLGDEAFWRVMRVPWSPTLTPPDVDLIVLALGDAPPGPALAAFTGWMRLSRCILASAADIRGHVLLNDVTGGQAESVPPAAIGAKLLAWLGGALPLAHLRTMIDRSPHAILAIDPSGIIRFANPAAARLFRQPAETLMGRDFGNPVIGVEFVHVTLMAADGQGIFAVMRAISAAWGDEPIWLAYIHPLTGPESRVQTLSRQLSQTILNALSSSIAVLDADGVILAVNRGWEEFARSNGDPELRATGVGVNYFEVCRRAQDALDADVEKVLAGMLAVMAGEYPAFEHQYACPAPDGTPGWYIMRVTPLVDGRVRGLVVSHIDVTSGVHEAQLRADLAALDVQARHQAHELAAMQAIAQPHGYSTVTGALFGDTRMRQAMPVVFEEMVARCQRLLDAAVEARIFTHTHHQSADLQALAEYLGMLKVGPRDVMDIYLEALKRCATDANSQRVRAYTEEGRIIVLELMGHLVAFYRNYLPPVIGTSGL